MPDKDLPARPNLEQYKKQAKDLLKDFADNPTGAQSVTRIRRHHPRFQKLTETDMQHARVSLTDAQLVIAREHGFESWPKFARHIETFNLIRSLASLPDPVAAFIEWASVPRHSWHPSGTLEHAEMILSRYPQVATANIYAAAILADESAVRDFLARDPKSATAKGGPHDWDALTYLCFSRYLRLDKSRSDAFVRTARALLDAGANANTGWFEETHEPDPTWESVIYGAAGLAQHAELTRLLLEYGADPNDDETPYHTPEGYDNAALKVLVESGKMTPDSLVMMLVRKADWHDDKGMQFLLEHGADPNRMTRWHHTALHWSVKRDNGGTMIDMLLDHGADPSLKNARDGRSATQMAARRGRGDILHSLEKRNIPLNLHGVEELIAACAKNDAEAIHAIADREPDLVRQLLAEGGTLLAEFSGTGNTEGVRQLLDLGVSPDALYADGDPYFDITKNSTALQVASWRAWPSTVKLLLERGAPVNALDARGRSALALAVRACIDSYWSYRRTPESVEALLQAGASVEGIKIPTGYDEIDKLLREHKEKS
jgi:ankyrin repeat protein